MLNAFRHHCFRHTPVASYRADSSENRARRRDKRDGHDRRDQR
jgi:hypothetical protein